MWPKIGGKLHLACLQFLVRCSGFCNNFLLKISISCLSIYFLYGGDNAKNIYNNKKAKKTLTKKNTLCSFVLVISIIHVVSVCVIPNEIIGNLAKFVQHFLKGDTKV